METHRPVELRNHVAVAEKGSRRVELVPLLHGRQAPSPGALALDQRVARLARRPGGRAPLAADGPSPQRAHRGARRPGDAAGHRLHLLPCRVRRRRGPMPVGRDAPHHLRGASRDPPALRGAHRGPARRGAARPRVRAVGGRARGGPRVAPRRADPRLSRGGGGLLLVQPAAGGVRHRDAGARHQHAGPHGRDRAAHQDPRARAQRAVVGGVRPDDGTGRPARPRLARATPWWCGPRRCR